MTITDIQSDLKTKEENSGWIKPSEIKLAKLVEHNGELAKLVQQSLKSELVGDQRTELQTSLRKTMLSVLEIANNYDLQLDFTESDLQLLVNPAE